MPTLLDPRYLPKQLEDGTFSRGIGRSTDSGHDWCWAPLDCISCGCSWNGPCISHQNIAQIVGWDGQRGNAPRPTDGLSA
jgi:hypothetical protein